MCPAITCLLGFIPGTNQLLITIPAAMHRSAGRAALVQGALRRTSGVPFIMITLAFAQMLYFLFVSLKAYGGDDGLIVRRRNVLADLNMARRRHLLLRLTIGDRRSSTSCVLRPALCVRGSASVLGGHPPERAPHGRDRHLDLSATSWWPSSLPAWGPGSPAR